MEAKLTYTVVINILAFIVYAYDKHRARRRLGRVSEHLMLLLALVGGSVGAYLAMRVCHNKMHTLKFRILVPVFFGMQIIAVLILY
ncbi:MAG: DUF1294 domain-containing protein [Prevotellaceae bacterium]|nr:DUF1294 domain-containing protein [Prevotellaceae bacterium]